MHRRTLVASALLAAVTTGALAQTPQAGQASAIVPTSNPGAGARDATPPYPAPAAARPPGSLPNLWHWEFDVRFAGSTGHKAFTLRAPGPNPYPVSRLTHSGGAAYGAEVAGRAQSVYGFFLSYYGGFGIGDASGVFKDQDFPPGISPYSQTSSSDRGSSIAYGKVDLGYMVPLQGPLGFGGFVGYEYLGQKDVASGCTQVAANPYVCPPGLVASGDRVVGDSENWQGVRVGAEGRLALPHGFTAIGTGAYLPFVDLTGADTHYARLGSDFARSTPVTGHGDGYEVEGRLDYAVNPVWTVSIGSRYTSLNANGKARLDESAIPVGLYDAQPVHYETQRILGYLSTGLRF